MTTENTACSVEVVDDVVPYVTEDGPGTRRVWLVVACRTDSTRFWHDYAHRAVLDEDGARALKARIERAWGAVFNESLLVNNPHWIKNTQPDPLSELAPFGDEWMREQCERAGL